MHTIFHDTFRKKFEKLPEKIQGCFYERLKLFVDNPRDHILHNHSVGKRFVGCRSLNVTGDYRAIFYESADSVVFINIGTHAQLYG